MSAVEAMIVPGSGGFLHLADKTPYGVQYSIENWTTLGEAFRFCYNHQPRIQASYEIGAMVLFDRECHALIRMRDEPMALSVVATEIGASIRAMQISVSRLRHYGLIAYDGEATEASELPMSEQGREVAHQLSA
jgi:hypothetical protein